MVQIFLCNITEMVEDLMQKGFSLLPEKEKEKIIHMKNEKQKKLSLVSKLLLQKILWQQGYTLLDCVPQKNGKPEIPQAEKFHFNLSHSGDYVLLAVSSVPVGADIEQIRERLPKGLERILSIPERDLLENLAEQDQIPYFFRIWTRKESYVKCLGERIFAKPFLFSMVKEGMICNQYKNCFFRSYDLEGYAISVCSFSQEFSSAIQKVSFQELLS